MAAPGMGWMGGSGPGPGFGLGPGLGLGPISTILLAIIQIFKWLTGPGP